MARLSKEIITQEVDRLKEMVKNGDIMRYSERDLEKQFKFTRKTLRKHLSEIKQTIGTRDIKVLSLRLINILDEIMQDIEYYWRLAKEQQDEKKIMYYTKQMFFAIEKFTDFLERFGIKEKVAEKFEADIRTQSISVQIIDDRAKTIPGGTDNEDYV